jgi:Flp pilus assembly protein TadD
VEDLTEKKNVKNTNLKGKAAVSIKNKNYDKAGDDCKAAIEISQNDPKALNRRSQAFDEALDKDEQTYSEAKAVHNSDPKNQGYISLFFFICMPRSMKCPLQPTR